MCMTDTLPTAAAAASGWHRTLWILQALLAVFFVLAGFGHTTLPLAELAQSAPWATDVPAPLMRFIGVAEMAGALGLVLPLATGIASWLTGIAAAGLALIMLLAVAFHIWRGEPFVFQLIVAVIAAVVARGRGARTIWHR
jgi:uncharacterized membrane protein YphA (DoxX/SURF4 family)